MAKNLNQAFINAYNKLRAQDAGPQPKSADAQALEPSSDGEVDYLLRIDTATVPMPEPHFNHPRPATRPVAVRVGDAPPKGNTATVGTADTDNSENAELRDLIASQMLQASDWQDQLSDLTQPTSLAGTRPDALSTVPSQPTSHELDDAEASQSPAFETRSELNRGGIESSARSEGRSAVSGISGDRPPVTDLEKAVYASGRPEAPSAPPTLPTQGGQDSPQQAVEKYLNRHGSEGGIYRLDRPSFEDELDVSEPEFADDIADVREAEQAAEELEHASELASHRKDALKAVESRLREARMQAFNPTWEVDQFHWPNVCDQLMEQCRESLMKVASNLVDATEEGMHVLAVTSPEGGEGRSTVACCLARLAAVSGLRVALLDADLENPTLCYQTNLDLDQDWKNAILERFSVEEVAVHAIKDQLTLIPLLDPIVAEEMDIDDSRIAQLLQRLASSFDLVVVDTGHMNSMRTIVGTLAEQGILNAVVTVVDQRITASQAIEACLARVRRAGITSVGLVENFTK